MKSGIDRATEKAIKLDRTRENIERATEKAIEFRHRRYNP